MSMPNTFESDILNLILNGIAIADIADNDATSPATNLYLSLHTADPGETGDQSTNEVSYTSYARAAIARNPGSPAWTISGTAPTSAVPTAAPISFPAGTGGAGTATHFGLGTNSSGAGKLLYKGALTPSIVCGNGVTPRATPTITQD